MAPFAKSRDSAILSVLDFRPRILRPAPSRYMMRRSQSYSETPHVFAHLLLKFTMDIQVGTLKVAVFGQPIHWGNYDP